MNTVLVEKSKVSHLVSILTTIYGVLEGRAFVSTSVNKELVVEVN